MTSRPLRVFLCHSSNDKPVVRELYQKLRTEPWIQPWLDEEELYPGQDWNLVIKKIRHYIQKIKSMPHYKKSKSLFKCCKQIKNFFIEATQKEQLWIQTN